MLQHLLAKQLLDHMIISKEQKTFNVGKNVFMRYMAGFV